MPYVPPLFPKKEGNTSRQAHTSLPDGSVEIEHGRKGFFGKVSHLYKSNPPTGWTRIEGNVRPHSLDLNKVEPNDINDPNGMPTTVLLNNEIKISVSRRSFEMPFYYRNADGDECIFVHHGAGSIETDYGNLNFSQGDYLIIPRGTSYRLIPQTKDNFFLIIEATDSEFELPDRGMLGPTAQFDPAMIDTPTLPTTITRQDEEWEIKVRRLGEITSIYYPFNPVQDTIGWKGDLCPWKVSINDFHPVVSPRYHLPPSVHTTFLARGFVICSFVPRPLESPDVLRIPFYHSNIDYDEVIFYHDGEFFSRHGIDAGNVTYHPPGILHGPQPQAFDRVQNNPSVTHTNEKAVMIDTRNPLKMTQAALDCEDKDYWKSWMQQS
ncbi:MAG: homogentisate 1,2-dioxygenase [Candidatus Kariarchaeaceae archaeon]|jgi:homogentisate 1,2-dioxygenase